MTATYKPPTFDTPAAIRQALKTWLDKGWFANPAHTDDSVSDDDFWPVVGAVETLCGDDSAAFAIACEIHDRLGAVWTAECEDDLPGSQNDNVRNLIAELGDTCEFCGGAGQSESWTDRPGGSTIGSVFTHDLSGGPECDDDLYYGDFEGPTCSICDGIGHGYPGGGPCPLEQTGDDDDDEPPTDDDGTSWDTAPFSILITGTLVSDNLEAALADLVGAVQAQVCEPEPYSVEDYQFAETSNVEINAITNPKENPA